MLFDASTDFWVMSVTLRAADLDYTSAIQEMSLL